MAVPNSENKITGLRPTRSDTRPMIGAKTNCAAEKVAPNTPICVGEASNRSAYSAKIGTTIPNPTRSRATVVQITQNPCGSGVLEDGR
jgi:hypothetical protein